MEGNPVFKWASYTMAKTAAEALDAAGVRPEDLDVFAPHQANMRITDAMFRALKLPGDVVVARDIACQGNTSAASIPLAIEALLESGEATVRRHLPDHRLRRRPGLCRTGDHAALRSTDRISPSATQPKEQLMPTTEEVRTDLAEIVNEVAGVPADDVQLDKSFTDDLDVDSLSMVEIIYAAEEKFGVSIPDEEAKNLKTVGDAVAYIERAPPVLTLGRRLRVSQTLATQESRCHASASSSPAWARPRRSEATRPAPGTALLAGRSGVRAIEEDWAD